MALHDEEYALPSHAEVVHIPWERGAPYPGIFIFTEVRLGGAGACPGLGCRCLPSAGRTLLCFAHSPTTHPPLPTSPHLTAIHPSLPHPTHPV